MKEVATSALIFPQIVVKKLKEDTNVGQGNMKSDLPRWSLCVYRVGHVSVSANMNALKGLL